ncbi:hypothetical protein MA16_Dca021210 [Dendrobium catenatum]|uniref:Uncharacterized protein n=1 Tax=Dendrobium catenatum TaxID=906689 RepID=A0A2I0WE06_9ASPA|nr:hypothetical protein MA16_Dca021210 [Dendrobium catenatum]
MTLPNVVGEEAILTLNNCMVNCIDDGGKDDVVNFDSAALELDATGLLGRPSEAVNVGVSNDALALKGTENFIGAFCDGAVVGEALSPAVIVGNEVSLGVVAINLSIVSLVTPVVGLCRPPPWDWE